MSREGGHAVLLTVHIENERREGHCVCGVLVDDISDYARVAPRQIRPRKILRPPDPEKTSRGHFRSTHNARERGEGALEVTVVKSEVPIEGVVARSRPPVVGSAQCPLGVVEHRPSVSGNQAGLQSGVVLLEALGRR